ncbi:VWFA and cache domain-containing protein [Dirofilaria immitis]
MTYTKCDPNINYCIKVINSDTEFERTIDKGCDTGNFCHTIGPRCLHNGFTDTQICCCTSNLCNGSSISYFHNWKLSLIVMLSIIITILNRSN